MTSTPTVLIAEDEPGVAAFLVRALREEGYTVLAAADGLSALAILEASRAPVDVLVADLRMPRMNGDKLAELARERGLARHIVFMTGFNSNPEAAATLGPILLKPFDPHVLARAVARLLKDQPIQ